MFQISHKSKVDITNIKMEMLRERGELERERDQLKNQIEGKFQKKKLNFSLTKYQLFLDSLSCRAFGCVSRRLYVCISSMENLPIVLPEL